MANVPLLDDRQSLLIDNIVERSSTWARVFVILWYRTECTIEQIASLCKIRDYRSVYRERHLVLSYYLGAFASAGLPVTYWVET
jgi:hypothetical protein